MLHLMTMTGYFVVLAVPIFWLVDLGAEPDARYVAMGVIDGNPELPEGYHIFVGSKAPWYAFDNPGEQFHTVPEE